MRALPLLLLIVASCGDPPPPRPPSPPELPARVPTAEPAPAEPAAVPAPRQPSPPEEPRRDLLEGRVVRPDGAGVPARFQLTSLLEDFVVERGVAAADGSFAHVSALQGPLLLTVEAPEGHAERLLMGPGALEPLVLRPPLELSGAVEESGHHSPLASYTLALLPAAEDPLAWLATRPRSERVRIERVEDSRGRFHLAGLPAGVYDLWLLAPRHRPERRVLDLTADSALATVSLQWQEPVRARLIDLPGAPLAGADCTPCLQDACGTVHPVAVNATRTDRGGGLWLPVASADLPLALAAGELGAWLAVEGVPALDVVLRPWPGLEVRFPPGSFGVARVIDSAGRATAPALFDELLTLPRLAPDSYRLEVAARHGEGWVLSTVPFEHSGAALTVLRRDGAAELRVAGGGTLVAGDGARHRLFPGADGTVRLRGLAPGAYVLERDGGDEVLRLGAGLLDALTPPDAAPAAPAPGSGR